MNRLRKLKLILKSQRATRSGKRRQGSGRLLPLVLLCIALFTTAGAQQPTSEKTLRATVDPHIQPYRSVDKLSGELVTIGSEWMDDLMKMWIDGFNKLYPNVHLKSLKRETAGAMGVEPALTEGRIQLAPVSRELMPFEIDRFKKKYDYEPLAIRVGLGSYRATDRVRAITFFVNESNPIKELTLAQLDAIFCADRKRGYKEDVFTWGQLGLTGEWANREILQVGLHQPEGTGNFVRQRVCLDGEFRKGIHELQANQPVKGLDRAVSAVAVNPAAITYGGFDNRKPGTKPIAIAEHEGGPYYTGTFEEVTSGKYPLTRFVHIYVNKAPGTPLDPKVKEFLKYVLSREGQQAFEKEGVLLPLPANMVEQELNKLN
jgi:phosphate transport system substrate-binding protein